MTGEKVMIIPSLSEYFLLLYIKKCGRRMKCRNPGFHGQYWTWLEKLLDNVEHDGNNNRIYNKIRDFDWF